VSLTERRIARLKPPKKNPKKYGDGNGLYLQVTKDGAKSWIFRYQRGAKDTAIGLGPLRLVPLKMARERARAAERLLLDGIDPLAARKRKQTDDTLAATKLINFEEAARRYLAAHEAEWKSAKFRAQVLNSLAAYAFPILGKLSVGDIDAALVLRAIEPIWRTKAKTAVRVRGRIENILDWAAVRGYRAAGDNPARWSGHLEHMLEAPGKIAKGKHHAALPYAGIGTFMTELGRRTGWSARALEMTILTAARTSEITGARWDEFDLAAKVWTIPAGRMKAGEEHRVPLSGAAIKILKVLPRDGSEWVFPGARGGHISEAAMSALVRNGMRRTDITVHGFRSTFRDWAAECTNAPNHVVEMALAHAISGAIEAAYRRGDLFAKRKTLMDAWATFCASPAKSGNVVPMRRSAK